MWDDLYAELTNKIRWAIGTAGGSVGCSWSYPVQKAAAASLASDVVAAMKLSESSPDYRWDKQAFQAFWSSSKESGVPVSPQTKVESNSPNGVTKP